MKRTVAAILVMIIVLSLVSCGSKNVVPASEVYADTSSTPNQSASTDSKPSESPTTANEATSAPHIHAFSDWEETKKATCEEDGERTRICTECGETETETIKAIGHSFTRATYFQPKTCSKCGITEGDPLATVIEVESEVEGAEYSFVVCDEFFTDEVSESKGSVRYMSQSGNYFVIQLSFTNLSTEPFKRWDSPRATDLTLYYDGKYEYKGTSWVAEDDIIPLDTQYVYLMYSVPASMEEDYAKSLVAVFAIDGDVFTITIREGDDSVEEETDQSNETNTERIISIGDTRTNGKSFAFTVSDVFYTTQVSESSGSTTFMSMEGYYLVIRLEFTNLSERVFERWSSNRISDLKLVYDEKYNYNGEYFVADDDIVPLETANLYVMYSVPERLSDDYDSSMIATFTVDNTTFEINCQENL